MSGWLSDWMSAKYLTGLWFWIIRDFDWVRSGSGFLPSSHFHFVGIKKENDSMVFFELVDFGFAMVWRSVWWLTGWLATVWHSF